MRLNSLTLTNFRQHVDTRIDFETGITGIIGPNGSGKSTILEAIAWALYGMPAARGNRESVRSYRPAGKGTVKVELDFQLGGHRYVVVRGLNSAELYLDGATAPIATSISAVTELLRRRLGMSHEEFFNTYFTGQKELSVMAAMGPSERAQFLSRVLGYERLRTAQSLVRDRRSAIVSEWTGLRAGLPDRDVVHRAVVDAIAREANARTLASAAETRQTASRVSLEEITPRWVQLQREREAAQALAAEIRVAEGERSAIERDLARIDRELVDAAAARAELDALAIELAPLPAVQAELVELERSANEAERRRTLTETAAALAEELERLRERRAARETAPALEAEGVEALKQARIENERAQADFESIRTDWVRDAQEAETKRKSLLDQLRDVQQQREQIVELGENGICPICARPLDSHFRKVLDVLDGQIETITIDGRYYKARIAQLATMPPELATMDERRRELGETLSKLERRQARVQSAVQELIVLARDIEIKEERQAGLTKELSTFAGTYDAERHAEARRVVERLMPIAARAAALSAQLEREQRVIDERGTARARLAAARSNLLELETRCAATSFSEDAFAELRAAHDRAVAELRSAELSAVAAEAELGSSRAALEVAQQTLADLVKNEQRLAALVIDRRLHDELDRAFTDLRTELNQALRPEISDLASRYIRDLTDGRYSEIELDDQYNIIVLEDAIPKPVISGGEEDLANLVLRLSISEMIAERAGQAFSLLILDEVFGSLDEAHRHSVVDLLRRLQGRFEQVILITHIESVRDGLDRVLSVRYDEAAGRSRVETDVPGEGSHVDTEVDADELTLDFQAGAAD